jgi:putative hemolysin
MDYILPTVVVIILLALSAFFSSGELAMMSLDELGLETAIRRGDKLAQLQRKLRAKPQRFLSAILIGNNVANIALATYSAYISLRWFEQRLGEQTALALSTVVLTVLVILFGELIPKTLAAVNRQRVAALVTWPLYIFYMMLLPLTWVIDKVLMPLIYLSIGGRPQAVSGFGREELATALHLASAHGRLHSTDAAVAREALHFSTRDLRDVMTPRVDMVALPATATVGEALQQMKDSGFSRLPVYGEGLDEILGVAFVKDLMRLSLSSRDGADWRGLALAGRLRAATFFPATKSVVEALNEMRQQRLHLAIVVDEHGGVAGVATLEDMLEELVGEISDETDHPHSTDIVHTGQGYLIASGRTRLDDVPGLAWEAGGDSDVTTLGGLLMEQLGRPAVVGDCIEFGGCRITALKVLKHSVKLARVEPLDGAAQADAGAGPV